MPKIQAFRGLRYDLGHVGNLSDVIAPPYDVINPELQTELYKKHPANVIRLILNREEPGDDDHNNRYSRAARFLKNWRSEGVLSLEPQAAVYVYHQIFDAGGKTHTRRGFMCRVGLERFGQGKIFPHEETHASAKADRLKLTTACKANLSQIFGLYPDSDNEAQELLEAAIIGQTPLEAVDHLGVKHRMWIVTDANLVTKLAGIMGPKPMYIADGHHRYETALNYRDQIAAGAELPSDSPLHCVLTMCVSMNDPGMVILPTHRLFRGLPPLASHELIGKLGDCFSTKLVGEGIDLADTVWETIEVEGEQGTFGLFAAKDERWVLARITEAGRRRMAEVAADHGPEWQGLGVGILHRLIIETLLEGKSLPKPEYVHLVEEAVQFYDRDGANEYPLVVLVMPATVDHIRSISERGERMPAKSTYFYPKLLSGLVINPLG